VSSGPLSCGAIPPLNSHPITINFTIISAINARSPRRSSALATTVWAPVPKRSSPRSMRDHRDDHPACQRSYPAPVYGTASLAISRAADDRWTASTPVTEHAEASLGTPQRTSRVFTSGFRATPFGGATTNLTVFVPNLARTAPPKRGHVIGKQRGAPGRFVD
jgi:hypothetical protein